MICWDARVEAMADYADYARKRDKENALTERGVRGEIECRPNGSQPGRARADIHCEGEAAPPSLPRSVSAFRCTRDDIDETGGAA